MDKNIVNNLLEFINKTPSQYHAIENVHAILGEYTLLKEEDTWELSPGGKYCCVRKDSSIIFFNIPETLEDIRIVAAHSDSPSFKIKPNGDEMSSDAYTRINVEKYGGMLMAQWMDRPLAIAGRVVTKSDCGWKTVLVNSDSTCIMPSVAIHMNREVNNGFKYDAKVDTIPLFGDSNAKGCLLHHLLENTGIDEKDVYGHDLFLYNQEMGRQWGPSGEFISSRALDDLECVYTAAVALSEISISNNRMGIFVVFDNEEVGSTTGQGADSTFMTDVLSRIKETCGYSESEFLQAIARGYMISADNGHAVHPNHPEYADTVNKPVLNGGVLIKYHAGQKYTTDAYSEAMIRDICEKADVPVQVYTNRSDLPGGSTLGNILNSHLSIKTVDIGVAQLSMHSPYETAGAKDVEYLYKMFKTFWVD